MGSGVCLSVQCLNITREWKGLGNPYFAGWKFITRVTGEPIISSKGQDHQAARPINAYTVNAQYLSNGKAYDVQT